MTIPPLEIHNAHVSLTVPVDEPVVGSDHTVEELSAALKGEYHASLQPGVPEGAPLEIPYVMFQGNNNARFAFSALQLDYDAEFTGAYRKDYAQGKEFTGKKAARFLSAWERVGAKPVWQSVSVTLQSSTLALDERAPLTHISDTLLQPETSDDMLNNVNINFRLHVLDRFEARIGVGEFERKNFEQTVSPGMQPRPIRPWELTLEDRGFEVTVEVDNRYGALVEGKHTRVTAEDLRFMNDLTWHIVEHVAIPLVREGVLNTESLQRVTA